MRMVRALTVALGVLIAAGGCMLSANAGEAAADLDGKVLFTDTYNCNMCHSVAAAGVDAKAKSDAMKGPDLAGRVGGEFLTIAKYVRKEADKDGKSHKKEFKGTDEELQAIIDWLGSLEAQE